MDFYNISYEAAHIPVAGEVEDIVILRNSIVVFYLQRYTVHDSSHIKEIKFDHFLKNKIVRPRQVQQELIAAVEPRGKLVILNPYKNQVFQILDLPMLTQRSNLQWFFFNQYYIFHESGMFTYREQGYGNSIGLATFKQGIKVSSFKHNITVKGSKDNVISSIDKYDNNCTMSIYEPDVKRPTFNLQLLTLPSNQIQTKPIDLGELYNLHKNIKVLQTKLIDEQRFMICISSQSVKSLILLLNQVTDQIISVLEPHSKFNRLLLQINNDPHHLLFESIKMNPPLVVIQALYTHTDPKIQNLGQIVSGDMLTDYFGKRIYKWSIYNNQIILHFWSVYTKQKLFRHLLREKRIDSRFGQDLCAKTIRLLKLVNEK